MIADVGVEFISLRVRNYGESEIKAVRFGAAAKNVSGIVCGMDPEDGKNLLVLGVVVGLIAICLFVLHLYSSNAAMERCVEEGRRDCTPISQTGQ
jgi:hypothetical protein